MITRWRRRWPEFVEGSFRQTPVFVSGADADPVFDPGRVLAALARAMGFGGAGRVYVGGARKVDLRLANPGPHADLQTLLAATRSASGRGGDVAWVVNDLQVHGPLLLQRARRFVAELLRRTGTPAGRLSLDAFAGDYDRLPFGVHRDPAETFLFGVQGVRRIRLWPGDAFTERVGPDDYQERLADAAVYDVGPGDVLYWPASFWHVGECPQGPSTALTLNWWTHQGPVADAGAAALAAWRRALRLTEEPGDAVAYPSDTANSPPRALTDALGRLPPFDAHGAEVAAEIKARWAARRSGLGFSPLPPPADVDAAPQRLTKATVGPLVAYREGDDLLVSANGYVGRFAQARLETVQRLEAGRTLDRSEVDPELALALARWRALA